MNAPFVLDRGSAEYLSAELNRTAILVPADGPVPRFWTAREIKILREVYPVGGVMAAAARLPGRTIGSVYQHAAREKLRSPREANVVRERWTSSPHIDDTIRRAYQSTPHRGLIRELAQRVMRPEHWVRTRAQRLGCVVPRYREPAWQAAEIAIITARATQDPATIRKALRKEGFSRTVTAIVVKLKRLRVSRVDPDDERLSARGFAELMGVDGKTVSIWIDRGLLRASEKGKAREDGRATEWRIPPADARRFIVENVAIIDLRKVEKHWFVDLLAMRGPGKPEAA